VPKKIEEKGSGVNLAGSARGFVGFVTRPLLEASQLPDVLADDVGKNHRPPQWPRHAEDPATGVTGSSHR